jgi:predicted nucleic acid-binding protein
MSHVDSDVLIDILRGFPPALGWLGSLTEPLAYSACVLCELIDGAANKTELSKAQALCSRFQRVWPDEVSAERALSWFLHNRLSSSLGWSDSLIASTAIMQNAELLTFNARHYSLIPGLRFREPYRRN